MSTYRIQHVKSGHDFGAYLAASPAAALDAMARDAGYPDHATACADSGDDGSSLSVLPCQDATRHCAICDVDRAPDAAGEERGDEWVCAACLATEPSDEPAS